MAANKTTKKYIAVNGDTLKSLAKSFYGDPIHAETLGKINTIAPQDDVPVSMELLLPPRIVTIVALDLAKFKKKASVWFQQCECKDKSTDCSDVVALYYHNDSMATKKIMVKPELAWRPNYKTKKLEPIPPETVKCGSMASEEGEGP